MKYLLSLVLVMAVAFSATAQTKYNEGYALDTVNNAETIYLYPDAAASAALAADFKDLGALEVVILADSLSGANAGSAILQYCYDDACAYTYDAATLTLNGATQQVSRTEDTEFSARKFRIKVTGSGTMSTKIQSFYTWKHRR